MLASYKENAAAHVHACKNYKKVQAAHFTSSIALASYKCIERSQSKLQPKAI